ncbi:MAG: preprotein translocase subunit SecG [Spirosomaceae bacterium]|nr:preprotein translocase subunit SecG [Spirosomataceae bacterium]
MTAIIVLVVIVSILLIIAVLVQNPKGGGLSSEFGGGATSQMFGVQRTGDLIENLTWGFFAFMIVGALATGIFFKSGDTATGTSSELDVESTQTVPVAPAPVMPAAPAAPAAEPAQ